MWCVVVRQVNLRLPEDLLERIDRARGLVPRNAWMAQALGWVVADRLGAIAPNRVVADAEMARGRGPVVEPPSPVVERSPKPREDSESSREPSPATRPTDEQVSAATGHKAGCKCLGCERSRGNVS